MHCCRRGCVGSPAELTVARSEPGISDRRLSTIAVTQCGMWHVARQNHTYPIAGKMENEKERGPEIPHGMHQSRKRGWGGGDMEIQHQRESSRKDKQKHVAAVEVGQFQNTVVGEGYQAKHVIRQPSKQATVAKLVDMTGGRTFHDDSKKSNLKSRFDKSTYIESKGLRDFRKEIERILSGS